MRVGYSFRKFVRERKVREVRRLKTSKTERTERNSLKGRDTCQTGTKTGNIQHHLVNYCLLKGSEATMQISMCRPAKKCTRQIFWSVIFRTGLVSFGLDFLKVSLRQMKAAKWSCQACEASTHSLNREQNKARRTRCA